MDIAFESIGTNGKFQKITSIIVIIVASMTLMQGITFPFMTKKPSFLCKQKDSLENYRSCNEDELCLHDKYLYLKDPVKSVINFSYDYDLYCDRLYIVPILGTSFFMGGVAGTIVLSPLPDKYGRAIIYKIILISCFLFHLLILFSFNIWIIVLATFLLGITSYGYSMAALIITEYLDRNTAGIVMSINNAVFPATGMIVAIFYIFFNNWRVLFFISSCLSLIAVYLGEKYFLESPRWLNSKNRFLETIDTLQKMAICNGNEKQFKKFIELNSSNYKINFFYIIFLYLIFVFIFL